MAQDERREVGSGTGGAGHGLRMTESTTGSGGACSDDMSSSCWCDLHHSFSTVLTVRYARPMSSQVRLGPVSYLVLGIVALRGPSTPYDLKRFVQLSIGHFWPFPHTQLYAEPARLADAGLLEEMREESGRRRRHSR